MIIVPTLRVIVGLHGVLVGGTQHIVSIHRSYAHHYVCGFIFVCLFVCLFVFPSIGIDAFCQRG